MPADILDKAREDERVAREASLKAAIAFLEERGGEFVEIFGDHDAIPPQVLAGLLEGAYSDTPTIKREWLDGGNARYSLPR